MKLILFLLILMLTVACSMTRTQSQPTAVLDPSQETSFHSEGFTVPIARFYPLVYPIDDALKWISSKLTQATSKSPK